MENFINERVCCDFIDSVLLSAREIIDILESAKKELFIKHSRGAGGDISIGADLISEEIFSKYLKRFGNMDSEESGFIDYGLEHTIVLDPLDGSDNFTSGIPYFGASIALCARNLTPKVGIVINFCSKHAIIGFNNQIWFGNIYKNFGDFSALLQTNISKCGIFERAYSNPEICQKLKDNNIKFRSLGALALSLGLGHNVDFVLYGGNMRHYDLCAGEIITNGLLKISNNSFVLISKDKKIFDKIAKILF